MYQCVICKRGNYQVATQQAFKNGFVRDLYCVTCRGLFYHYTRGLKIDAKTVEKVMIKHLRSKDENAPSRTDVIGALDFPQFITHI